MTDWADDAARAICPFSKALAYRPHEDEVAKALRKAKACGMREAVDFIAPMNCNGDRKPVPMLHDAITEAIISNINWQADRIERGEA